MTAETAETAEAELERLRRRQRRNLRHARAKGFLEGVCAMLGPRDLVVDCGANVGDVTRPLAETGAGVIAFEPDPWAVARLRERVADLPNVTVREAAVGSGEGSVTLRRAAGREDNPKGASVKSTVLEGGRGISDRDAVEVPLVDFPAFLEATIAERGEIAFLKMDIEGAELDVLAAMAERRLFDRIRCTVAETHERKFKALRPRFRELRERIGAEWPASRVNLDWI